MNNNPFQEFVGQPQRLHPREILQQQFEQMHNQFAEQERILQETPMSDEDFSKSMAELQSRYIQAKSKFDSSNAELDTVERLTQQGLITPEAGEQAMFKMTTPPEVSQAMYPRQPQPESTSPFLPGTLQNFDETIVQFAESAPEKKGLEWGDPGRTQSGLTAAYMRWRKYVQYDEHDSSRQKQLDMEWDSIMNAEKRYEWNPNSAEVRILRSRGPLGSAIANKKFKTPTQMSNVGPMQNSIARQTPQHKTEQRVWVVGRGGKVGTVPSSQLQEALESGYRKL